MMTGEVSYLAAEILILRSTGPSIRRFRPGQRVADDTRFTLRPGDSLSVLTRGRTRTFRGPGTFGANDPIRLSQLQRGTVRRNLGTIRGTEAGPDGPRPSNIWFYDVGASGRACVLAGRLPILWRANVDRTVRLTINPPSGASQTLNWEAGQATLTWPTQMPVVDGASYQLSWTGGTAPVRVTTRTLTAVPADNYDAVATAFMERECRGQLDALIATREATEDSADAADAVAVTAG